MVLITLLQIYLVFACATAITSWFTLFKPVLNKLESEHKVVEFKVVTSVTFLCISFIAAPYVFFIIFSETGIEAFKDSMYESLSK